MKPWACNRKRWCKTMADRLNPTGHGKGFNQLVLMDMRTGKDLPPSGIFFRKDSKDNGVLLNRCPWCGQKIDFIVQDQKRKAKREKP